MKQDNSTERALALRFSKGDEVAFKDIYERYYPSLSLYAKSYTLDAEEAADIAMLSFEKLWARHQRFDSLYGIRGFLWLTVRNACINYIKDQQLKQKVLDNFSYLSPKDEKAFEMQELNAEVFTQLLQSVETLPGGCREVFKLMFYNRLSVREVSERLGITEATVRSQKRNAVEYLKEKLSVHQLAALLLYFSVLECSAHLHPVIQAN